MNYFFLSLGIFAGLLALYCLTRLVVVALGRKRFRDGWGFFVNAAAVSICGPLAAWLVTLAVAA